ncbi:MAG TPA: endonuclease/exonuclease/phosphatase family protein [Solirubrobacteraceae bacterium]|nr:endonuclease/exonuclease/phosphatase family protein [Solirubrobacteraceae bacterium]
MPVRVLTWNLKHGRADPSAGRYLLVEFATALAGWEWDVALLQEVPPWWPPALARAAGDDGRRCEARAVLTSRNAGLPLRRALATRWPDLMKSNGGGANAILVRAGAVSEHRTRMLRRWPERRRLHAVRLEMGLWVGNLHATAHHDTWALRDDGLAARTLLEWAGGAPCVLGGDFNLRALTLEGLEYAGGHDVDHVFARGLVAAGPAQVLVRGQLSDHAPVAVTLR